MDFIQKAFLLMKTKEGAPHNQHQKALLLIMRSMCKKLCGMGAVERRVIGLGVNEATDWDTTFS